MLERPSSDATLEIVPCTAAHYELFRRLNYEWIDRYFGLEKVDRDRLDAPQAIIDHGGHDAPSLYARSNIHIELRLANAP